MAINQSGVSKGTGLSGYQDIDGLLKDFYGPRIVGQLNNKNWAYDKIKKVSDLKWSGRQVKFPIHDRRNVAIGFRNEDGDLPLAGGQRHQQATVTDTKVIGTIELTDEAMQAVLSDRGGFARAMETEQKGIVTDMADHMGFSVWHLPQVGANTSLNCIRARVAPAGGGATATLVTPGGYANAPTGFGATRYLKVNDTIVWGTLVNLFTGGTPPGAGRIASIDSANQTITVDNVTGANPANDNYIVRGDAVTQGKFEFDNGLNGLGALTAAGQPSSGTFQGIPITAGGDYSWRTYRVASAGPFDEADMHSMLQAVREVGDGDPNCLISHYSLRLEYLASLQSQTRYANTNLKGGYTVLTFASDKEYDWVIDKYCPYGHLFAMDLSMLFWAQRKPFHWDNAGGSILKSLAPNGKDAVRAFYKSYTQLAWLSLNSHGLLDGVTVSGTVF